MRLVYFGSGEFGLPTLRALLDAGHELITVFTQPDRRAGRGGQVRFTPVKELALTIGISIYQPENLRGPEPAGILEATGAELAVVVAYGQLIPGALLSIPRHGFINLHASLLPAYRGAAPVPRAILAGETVSGATVFRLNERFDAGDILGREELPIRPDDTSGSYLERLAPAGARLVQEVVGQLAGGWLQPLPQDERVATRAPKLHKDEGRLDWSRSAAELDRQVRGLQPWPLAYTFVPRREGARRLVVLQLDPAGNLGEGQPTGVVLRADPHGGVVVRCGDGAVRLSRLCPEGKHAMTDCEFMRGARLVPGTTLG